MLAKLKGSLLLQALVLLLASLVASCNGGGSSDGGNNPDQLAPSIFNLSRSAAQAGDEVVVTGSNFGTSQGGGSVTLNGTSFQVSSWSDSQLRVVVVSGMSSGIVVVKQGGMESQSGANAQLIIGTVQPGTPLIYSVSPDYGRRGTDEVLFTGINFGSYDAANGVYFASDAAGTPVVKAEVSLDPNTSQPKWTNSAITVKIPANSVTGDVYVEVNGAKSNKKAFVVQPPPGSGNLLITSITPANGPVGTSVDIAGDGFGNQQGGSTATLNGIALPVTSWSNNLLTVTIPAGAVSGPIRVTVNGEVYDSQTFVVANTPVITGVSPSAMKIGQPVTIFGKFFGFAQGTGRVNIGTGSPITVGTWDNGTITIPALPAITGDPNAIQVTVTADNGLTSAPFTVTLATSLVGNVSVSPKIGVAGKTQFAFNVSVAGGSGNYTYKLFPIDGDTATNVSGSSLPLKYTYANKGTYDSSVQVTDTTTGDVALLLGPTVQVVGADEVVITGVEPVNFGQIENSENEWSRWPDPNNAGSLLYNDFVFFGGQIFYTSAFTGVASNNQELPFITRDPNKYLSGASLARPFAWRRTATPTKVRIRGFNLGAAGGSVWIKSSAPGQGTQINAGQITWPAAPLGDEETIEFNLPTGVADSLSGFVSIQRSDNQAGATSIDPLVCSAVVTSVIPNTGVDIATGTVSLSGFDYVAPQISGVTGPKTYLFWIANATYDDPFNPGTPVTQPVLTIYPIDVTNDIQGALLDFDMSRLDKDGDTAAGVQTDIEHYNAAGTQFAIVPDAKLVAGTYFAFFWTGVLDTGTNVDIANSGIMSQVFNVKVTSGGGGGTFTIDGTVLEDTDADNVGDTPLAGVTVSAGASSDTTDAQGKYTLTGLTAGSKTVTPSLAGFTFTPPSRNVSVGPNATGIDFVAHTGGGGGNNSVAGTVSHLTQNWDNPFDGNPPDAPTPGAGVEVWANDLNFLPDTIVATPVTDANGAYSATGLADQTFGITVNVAPASVMDTIFLPIGGLRQALPDFGISTDPQNITLWDFIDKNHFLVGGA